MASLLASVELLAASQSWEHGSLLSPGLLRALRLWWWEQASLVLEREQALLEQGPRVPEPPSWALA